MNTIKHFHYGDKEIDLAIPVDIDIDKFSTNDAVLFFCNNTRTIKKVNGKDR